MLVRHPALFQLRLHFVLEERIGIAQISAERSLMIDEGARALLRGGVRDWGVWAASHAARLVLSWPCPSRRSIRGSGCGALRRPAPRPSGAGSRAGSLRAVSRWS